MEAPETVKVAYYRGGSSKALFFHDHDLPPVGSTRDAFLKRIMGTPDVLQIDGMGGSRVVTSKIAIIKKSSRPDADVDYTFCQVGITDDTINCTGNCGNISSAVGSFAITEGLVRYGSPGISTVEGQDTQKIRIYNTGSKKILISHVPIDKSGSVIESGNFAMAAVPGTGAPILMDYSQTIGAAQGNGVLPTRNVVDKIDIDGSEVEITICDVANLCIFLKAEDTGLSCTESAEIINSDDTLRARLRQVRGKASVLIGRCSDWQKVDEESPFLPMIIMVARSASDNADVNARLILDNRCHDSMAGTGAICLTACSRVQGSVVHQILSSASVDKTDLTIAHPLGVMPIAVELSGKDACPDFNLLSFIRTARRIMVGRLSVPPEVAFEVQGLQHEVSAPPSITESICGFIHEAKQFDLPDHTIRKLKDLLLDTIGVGLAASNGSESSKSLLLAVTKLAGSSGPCSVWGQAEKLPPRYAAMLNASFSHSFDFDDTFARGSLHPGCTVISAGLAQAEISGCSGKSLLNALAVGYEVVCRLGAALGTGGYSRGFHNTSTAGIFGAVATIAVIKQLPLSVIRDSVGIAGSQASGSMQFLENGSWNKRLHPGLAVHNAFMAVNFAEAGVVGSAKAIEGKYGFLNAYSAQPNYSFVLEGLGSQWLFEQTAPKPFPACRMTHSAIELAAKLGLQEAGRVVKKIVVQLSPACWNIVGVAKENKIHPKTIVDAQFSIYFQVATAWLFGMDLGWRCYDDLEDAKLILMCDKITCVPDEGIRDLEARVNVSFDDEERERHETITYPLGEDENPYLQDRLRGKFVGLARSAYSNDKAQQILDAIEMLDQSQATNLLKLL